MFEYKDDLLIVDELIHDPGLPNSLVIRVDDSYYMINSSIVNLASKPIPIESLRPYKKKPNPKWDRAKTFEYLMAGMIPREGFQVSVKRPITPEEFEALCNEYGLTDDDISDEFIDTIGAIYGEEYAQQIVSLQIKIHPSKAIELEEKLQNMGIQANNVAPGRVNIRTSGHGGKREGAGRKPTGRKQRSIWLNDEEYEKVKEFVKSLRGEE